MKRHSEAKKSGEPDGRPIDWTDLTDEGKHRLAHLPIPSGTSVPVTLDWVAGLGAVELGNELELVGMLRFWDGDAVHLVILMEDQVDKLFEDLGEVNRLMRLGDPDGLPPGDS